MTCNITSLITKKHLAASVLAVALLGYSLAPAFATQTVTTNVNEQVAVNLALQATDCSNNPGPFITLGGTIGFGAVSAQFLFENNVKGTHSFTSTVTATAVPSGFNIQIPKQPVLGGVGGNPYIFVQFVDSNGNPITSPVFIGRCVQGDMSGFASLSIPSTITSNIAALECDNTASDVDFSGNLVTNQAVTAQIIFTNNADGTHTNNQVVSATLLPAGFDIEIPKQPVQGGVGGNPYIYLQFQDANGNPLASSTFLGRCVQNF
jgi:hypothetical protein